MKRALMGSVLMSCAAWLALGQSAETPPRFEIADVHVSAKTSTPYVRSGPVHDGRYEVKTATMVDLIRIAYGFDTDKILGGPSWLEMDRFDILAKAPADPTEETQKLMLQALLEDRFKLVVHKDTKPLPTYALTAGKKPQLKEADGSGETGCKLQPGSSAPAEGGVRIMMSSTSGSGAPTTINLGPGMVLEYVCRNMSMASFAGGLRGMLGANVGTNPVLDQTGLKGIWNFDLHYSLTLVLPIAQNTSDRVTLFDAVDKELGLKLEEKQIPTPVIVVDSVNQKPSANPPGLAEALPPTPVPTEFEVASVKPSDPGGTGGRFQMQAGGRLTAQGMTMSFLLARAFSTTNITNSAELVGTPKWADTERFDIFAKTESMGPTATSIDPQTLAPLLRSLLVDRFKLAYHTEDRPVNAYSLVSAKPKLKKADPASRTFCKTANAPAGAAPGSQILTCQNVTLAQFADRLQNMSSELTWPVLDATGIEGNWDISLIFTRSFGMIGAPRAADSGQPGAAVPASDPSGGYTLFEALEKQLGLKLEMQKRALPVTVIDRLEQKPTEN